MEPRSIRNIGHVIVVGAAVWAAASTRAVLAKPSAVLPLRLGQKQLFLDDYVVQTLNGVERTMHQVRKWPHNPVLRPEHPWELNRVATRSSPVWNREARRWEYYYFAHAAEKDNAGAGRHAGRGGRRC